MADKVKFAVGGAVQAKAGTYLRRPADEDLFEACQAGEFAYVLCCRQIGKTSLMNETAERLDQEGVRTARIDLSNIGQRNVDADSWYFSLIVEITHSLKLEVDVQSWWEKRPRLSTNSQRFLQFLREVVLQEITESIVIFVDEIDTTLGLVFTDDFFINIRSVYNDRAQYPPYRRLTFVLLGVATPDELIKDNTRTPYNVGRAINLRDFTRGECEPFRRTIETRYPNRNYFDQIYAWTAGHPYLTQKLCRAILNWSGEDHPELVDKQVNNLFLAPPDRGDDNLQFVQSRVMGDPHTREMLRIYERVLQPETPVDDDEQSPPINRLKLYGLVIVQNGRLRVRNKLYARAFDKTWTEDMLEKSTKRLGLPRHYRIVQEIGQGGFATIYLAQTTLDSGETKNVALKVLNLHKEAEPSSAKLIKRFEREKSTIARLNHPNIIRIHETGLSDTGGGDEPALFIAMEYIPGGSLRKKLKEEGPLRRDEAVAMVKQIGAALSYAHGQGVIHRDVKPGNILLDTSQEPLRPVLTDFGLVKDLSADDQTSTSKLLGTARYMAPEQLAPDRWKHVTPTPATDVYALAITFFEMLVGEHPFEVDSDHRLTDAELAEKHLNDPLPLLKDVAPEIGPFFDDVLRQATAKNPTERFDSIAHFVTALEVANNEVNQSRATRLVEVAKDYLRDGDSGTALDMIDRALQVYPGYVEALRLKGQIKFEQDVLPEALENYRQAYEQERQPSSEVGRDYLKTLRYVAQNSWQQARYQEAVEHYGVIKQVLDEGRAAGVSVQEWTDAWTELVEDHYSAGGKAYAGWSPENVNQVTDTLQREIEALEALKAERESRDLREKLRTLQIKYHYGQGDQAYAAGSPANIAEAMETLEREIETLAGLKAERESRDLREKLRALQIKHHYGQGDQAYAAGSPANIDAAIKTLEREIEALEGLEAERESQDLKRKLRSLQVTHHYNEGDQAYAAGSPANIDAAIETLEREIEALAGLKAERESQDLKRKLRSLQVTHHYNEGDRAYAAGGPANIDEAIETLAHEIQVLEALKAERQSQDLRQKLTWLQIKKHKNIVEKAESAINQIDTQAALSDETAFQPYLDIDKAYQSLIELEPENELWPRNRLKKLKEQAELRQKLAGRAERKHKYETALRHYRAILDIEQTKGYQDIAQDLSLDLSEKIAELEKKADYDRKYQEIEKLIANGEYLKARDRLVEDFISKGIYEHRDVAKLLWGVVYAKQNGGQFPPEWESVSELAEAKEDLQKLGRQHRLTSALVIIPSLIIGVVMGILITMIAPWTQNLSGLAAITVVAILVLIGVWIITKRIGE